MVGYVDARTSQEVLARLVAGVSQTFVGLFFAMGDEIVEVDQSQLASASEVSGRVFPLKADVNPLGSQQRVVQQSRVHPKTREDLDQFGLIGVGVQLWGFASQFL